MSQLVVRIDQANKSNKEMRDFKQVWNSARLFVFNALAEKGVKGRLRLVPIRTVYLWDEDHFAVSMTTSNTVQFEHRPKSCKSGWLYNISPDGQKHPSWVDVLHALSDRIMASRRVDAQPVAATQSLNIPNFSDSDNSIILSSPVPEAQPMQNGVHKPVQKMDLHDTGDLLRSVVTAVDRIQSNRHALAEGNRKLASLKEEFQRLKETIAALEDSVGYLKIAIEDDQEGKQAETFMAQMAEFQKRMVTS